MIRPYIPSDISRMSSIWLEASLLAHDFIPRSFWEGKESDMQNVYLPSCVNYVYIEDITGEVAGFISVNDGFIPALFVAPSMQKRGIGKQLLDYVKRTHAHLSLHVYAKNHQAISFYEKQGFRITEERTERQSGEQEYVMEYP